MVNFIEMKKLSVSSFIISLLFILSCEDKKDTTPPELTILSPTSGSTVGEIVQIKVQTTDESGILKVDFYIQNSMVLSDTTLPYEYEWNTTTNQDGEYKVKVVSFDTKENFVESEFSVTVDNESKKPSPLDISSVEYDLEKMTVKWNQSQESDFKQYNIHYSESENGTKKLVKMISDKSIISYDTTSFDPTKENWYFIEVIDSYGLSSIGKGKTNEIDLPPQKPVIISIKYIDSKKVFEINWSKDNDNDFKSYILYEANIETPDFFGQLVKISDNVTSYERTVDRNVTKLFKIEVEDYWGQKSISDEFIGSSHLSVIYTVGSASFWPQDAKELRSNSSDFSSLNPKNVSSQSQKGYNWSNDGKTIVGFNAELMRTFGYNHNSSQDIPKDIYTGSGLSNPIFSSDDSKIFFIDGKDIKVIDNDGSNMKIVLRSEYLIKSFDLSPNGEKIVYEHEYGSTGNEITVFDWVSGTKLQSTKLTGVLPKWVNDDEYLYISRYPQSGGYHEINKVKHSDFTWEKITNHKGENLGLGIKSYSFSPDRSKIIYINKDKLKITYTAGNGTETLGTYYDVTEVVFSPDGKYIYYATMGDGLDQVIRSISYHDGSYNDIKLWDRNQNGEGEKKYYGFKFQPKYPE